MLGRRLTTRGIGGWPPNLWVARLPVLAIAGFAACLAAAAWPGRWPAVWAGRWPRGILAIGAAVLGLVPGVTVVWPAAGGGLAPLPGEAPVRLALVVAAAVALVAVGAVHWWRWRLGFDRLQLTLVVACLGLGPAALRSLAEGAYLHDVGKVGIPDHVLNKPGALSKEERGWIQQHPVVGSDIVGRAPSLRGALKVIRQHHERFDGHGYPDGLAGGRISLAARIVAVADVWDALTSDRAYRPVWPPDRALRHLVAGRGTHFDPHCLDAFLA